MYCFTCSRLAHGEIHVAALPLEVGVVATAFLQPDVRDAFDFLHLFGLRDGAPEAREQMHMVLHAADKNERTIELFGDAAGNIFSVSDSDLIFHKNLSSSSTSA
jgi:hypothetical protein